MSKQTINNSKRIAKNTILLYFRMIVTTIVSLYTARLILRFLGVEDYGISNVVGGLIGFMSILTSTMTSATQRFLSYDLGTGNIQQYKCTYSMLIYIYAIFCIFCVLLMEMIGPYCIQKHLVIPPDRLIAAQWLFQFTIVNFIFATISIPMTSSIVAYEKMGVYAYFTFIDVFFKLVAVLALYLTPIDKLITYGLTTSCFQIVTNFIIFYYCWKHLEGCKVVRFWDKNLFKRMVGYAGWNLFGSTTNVMNRQGQTLLLNLFFGPVVNAAKAIADKIDSIVFSFGSNFYMAVSPQIIKSYAAGEIDYMRKLVLSTSKYSFYLLFLISLPLILNMKELLGLWLGGDMVSQEMIYFAQLELIFSLVNVLENPITMAIRATGTIRKYQICVGIQTLMFIPICYFAFFLGFPAYSSMIILSTIYAIVQFVRVYLVKDVIKIKIGDYIIKVLSPILRVVLIVVILCYFCMFKDSIIGGLMTLIANSMIAIILTLLVVLLCGLNDSERVYIYNILKRKMLKREIK